MSFRKAAEDLISQPPYSISPMIYKRGSQLVYKSEILRKLGFSDDEAQEYSRARERLPEKIRGNRVFIDDHFSFILSRDPVVSGRYSPDRNAIYFSETLEGVVSEKTNQIEAQMRGVEVEGSQYVDLFTAEYFSEHFNGQNLSKTYIGLIDDDWSFCHRVVRHVDKIAKRKRGQGVFYDSARRIGEVNLAVFRADELKSGELQGKIEFIVRKVNGHMKVVRTVFNPVNPSPLGF